MTHQTRINIFPGNLTPTGQVYSVKYVDWTIVERSKDPEHDAARALLKRGYPHPTIEVWGETGHRSTLNIAKAAGARVSDSRFGLLRTKWRPFTMTVPPRTGETPKRAAT